MSWAHMNRDLTRKLVSLLERPANFPPSSHLQHGLSLAGEYGAKLGALIDIVDLPHKLVDTYRFLVVAEARSLRRSGKLTTASCQALVAYEQALLHEQRACNLLMRQLSKDYGNDMVSLKK